MFFFWYLLNIFLVIHSCISDQLCIDTCKIRHDMHTSFELPPECTVTRREQCTVLLIFNYAEQTVTIDFAFESYKQHLQADYQTDNVVHSVITLQDPPFVEHNVEYYCSTGDNCDLNYVKDIAIPQYSAKTCTDFRTQLIRYLNPDNAPAERDCFQIDNSTSLCNLPCQLEYHNPNSISRSCDGTIDIGFETTVGQSTPTNKPEYNSRQFAYGCMTEMCNGIEMQYRIQRLISMDNGECMIILNKTFESTTSILTTIPMTTTTPKHHNHGTTFSKSFILIIFILNFVYFFP